MSIDAAAVELGVAIHDRGSECLKCGRPRNVSLSLSFSLNAHLGMRNDAVSGAMDADPTTPHDRVSRVARFIFLAGVAIYFALHIGYLQFSALRARHVPVEPDDAYSYMMAAPLLHCAWGKCQALEDLRTQLETPSPYARVSEVRNRPHHRLFVPYHPLHAVLLLGLRKAGVAWESAYDGIWLVGAVLVLWALAGWLRALVGPGGAGVALMVLAFGHFQEQGLDEIVPSTLSMALAMLSWTMVVAEKPRRDWLLPLLVASIIAMHVSGLLWAAITVSSFVLLRAERSRQYRVVAAVCVLVWCVGVALIGFSSGGLVSIGSLQSPFAAGGDVPAGLRYNLSIATRVAAAWVLSFGGGGIRLAERFPATLVRIIGVLLLVFFGGLCAYGARSLSRRSQKAIALFGFLVTGVAVLGVFYVIPRFPPPLFVRSWVFVATLSAGLGGRAVWLLATRNVENHIGQHRAARPGCRPSVRPRSRFLPIAALFGVVATGALRAEWGLESLRILRDSMVSRGNVDLDRNQPNALERLAPSRASVLYLGEVPMYFYLTYGASRLGAVYYPAVANTPEEERWVHANPDLQFVVGSIPAAGVVYNAGDTVTVAADSISASELQLKFGRSPENVTLAWWHGDRRTPAQRKVLELGRGAWVTFPLTTRPAEPAESLTVQIETTPEAGVRLEGLRYDARQTSNWPWNSGTKYTITTASGTPPRVVRFDLRDQVPIRGRTVEVVEDHGGTFLARVR